MEDPAVKENEEHQRNAPVAKKPTAKSKRYSSAFDLKPTNSPKTHEEKKARQAVVEFYQGVVKQVQENKLTAKSALQSRIIIDEMDVVLKQAAGNFHKASCALSTAAEVYCVLVDDFSETATKVQELLFNSDGKRGEMDAEDARANRKKGDSSSSSNAATLEAVLSNIRSDEVDAEIEVDPLFQKLLQEKESGTQGTLLNILDVSNGPNLALNCHGIPAFASRSSPINESSIESASSIQALRDVGLRHQNLDIEFKVSHFFSAIREEFTNRTSETLPTPTSVVDKLDPRISFHSSEDLKSIVLPEQSQTEEITEVTMNNTPEQDDYYDNDDFGGGFDQDEDDFQSSTQQPQEPTVVSPSVRLSPEEIPINPHINLIMKAFENQAMETETGQVVFFNVTDLQESTDQEVIEDKGKVWLGDFHWKAPRKASRVADSSSKKSRKPANVKIDFFAPPLNEKVIFAPSARSNRLPKNSFDKNNLLPRNAHFDVLDLCRFFLRPKTILKPIVTAFTSDLQGDGVVIESDYVNNSNMEDYGNDDYDDDNEFYDCASSSDTPMKNLVAPAHHVERIRVAYATRAKKVDVKKLKSNLWDTIDELDPTKIPEQIEKNTSTFVNEPTKVSLVSSIRTLVPKQIEEEQSKTGNLDVSNNITVPFYFICMLHLANEKGLELRSSQELDDVSIFRSSSAA